MADRILLVEDNDENRAIFATILDHYGFEVIEAADGCTALELARRHRPDMVLLDLGLPGLDGLGVLDGLAEDPGRGKVPVMVVTAHVAREVERRCLDRGARRYLTKPIAPRALVKAVRAELAAWRRPGLHAAG